jgi:transcriptional regulator with XRE-family HTH domain
MAEQGVIAVPVWTGREAKQLRTALRMSQREYAAFLGAAPRTVAGWDTKGKNATISTELQAALDTALRKADPEVRQRFEASVLGDQMASANPHRAREQERIPVTATDIVIVRDMLASLTAVDHQRGGGFARYTADTFFREVIKPRLAAPGPNGLLIQFRAAAAEFQIRTAWMHLDVADHAGARAAAREACGLAQQSGDLAVCSWTLAMSALLETWLGNTATAVAYGHTAVGLATGGPPLVRAFAHGKLARALAASGDSGKAQAALVTASSLFDSARSHDDDRVPEAIRDGYSGAYILDEEAHCFRDLGMHGIALERSQQSLDLRGADRFTRNRAFATGNRALTLAKLGEIDQASAGAVELLKLAATLDSSRVTQRMEAVVTELEPFRSVRAVTELIDQVNGTESVRLRMYRSGGRDRRP